MEEQEKPVGVEPEIVEPSQMVTEVSSKPESEPESEPEPSPTPEPAPKPQPRRLGMYEAPLLEPVEPDDSLDATDDLLQRPRLSIWDF